MKALLFLIFVGTFGTLSLLMARKSIGIKKDLLKDICNEVINPLRTQCCTTRQTRGQPAKREISCQINNLNLQGTLVRSDEEDRHQWEEATRLDSVTVTVSGNASIVQARGMNASPQGPPSRATSAAESARAEGRFQESNLKPKHNKTVLLHETAELVHLTMVKVAEIVSKQEENSKDSGEEEVRVDGPIAKEEPVSMSCNSTDHSSEVHQQRDQPSSILAWMATTRLWWTNEVKPKLVAFLTVTPVIYVLLAVMRMCIKKFFRTEARFQKVKTLECHVNLVLLEACRLRDELFSLHSSFVNATIPGEFLKDLHILELRRYALRREYTW